LEIGLGDLDRDSLQPLAMFRPVLKSDKFCKIGIGDAVSTRWFSSVELDIVVYIERLYEALYRRQIWTM